MGNGFDAEEFLKLYMGAQINSNAEAEWENYRRQVTDFLIRNAEKGSSLTIYGAGRCNDLDLKRLSLYFSEITLADRDAAAMNGACPGENINCEVIDFLGIEDIFFIRFINCFHDNIRFLHTDSDYEEFKESLMSVIEEAYASVKDFSFRTKKKSDYAVMLGLHSQLNNIFSGIWNYVMEAVRGLPAPNGKMLSEFTDILLRIENRQKLENTDIIRRVNSSVLEMTERGVFLGYELWLKNCRDSLIEGAYQASGDFESREKGGSIKCRDYERAVWPLNKKRNIIYEVMLGVWDIFW